VARSDTGPVDGAVTRVLVGTDRSETADRAVRWAALLADRYAAELLVAQVIIPENPPGTEAGTKEGTLARYAAGELQRFAEELAGGRGRSQVVVDEDPADAILRIAAESNADTIVVGNVGMAGRKKFLLGNVPNRISHNARCTVIIVNTSPDGAVAADLPPAAIRRGAEPVDIEPHLTSRAAHIASVMAKHGLRELFGKRRDDSADVRRERARSLRAALEELGPVYAKLGQVLSTRPDLLPSEFIEELASLQDDVPPLSEGEVVEVMEEELQVPWEDVFDSVEPAPLAAGTIAQVHRATLTDGSRVVIKVQRPTAREEIMQDLSLLELFAEKTQQRPALKQVIDVPAVFAHLSDSLQRELDFRREASNIERMREVLSQYDRLGVPEVYGDYSTSRLLVMEEIQGVPVAQAPEGKARKEAARQLLESYYRQILVDGFFHADPHPGNLMWLDGKIYFLDFGMVGELGPALQEHLMMLLLSFWQNDIGFLTDVTLMLSGGEDRSDLDVDKLGQELGDLMARNRDVPLKELQLGPILQEMTEISMRHDLPLPSSLALTGKAMAQMQLATAELDPDLDPFDVAGSFIMRTMTHSIRGKMDPRKLFYESQKVRIRLTRLMDSLERLVGAKPGPKLQVNFRAVQFEEAVHHAAQRLALGMTAGAVLLATAITAAAERVATWVPIVLGGLGGLLVAGLVVSLLRRRFRPGHETPLGEKPEAGTSHHA